MCLSPVSIPHQNASPEHEGFPTVLLPESPGISNRAWHQLHGEKHVLGRMNQYRFVTRQVGCPGGEREVKGKVVGDILGLLPTSTRLTGEGGGGQVTGHRELEAGGGYLPKRCVGAKDPPRRSESFRPPGAGLPSSTPRGAVLWWRLLLRAPPPSFWGWALSHEPEARPAEQRREIIPAEGQEGSLERGWPAEGREPGGPGVILGGSLTDSIYPNAPGCVVTVCQESH